jgi:hypothetical protein
MHEVFTAPRLRHFFLYLKYITSHHANNTNVVTLTNVAIQAFLHTDQDIKITCSTSMIISVTGLISEAFLVL